MFSQPQSHPNMPQKRSQMPHTTLQTALQTVWTTVLQTYVRTCVTTLTSSWMRRQTWTRMYSMTVTMTWTSLKTGVKTSWHTRPMGGALHDSAETLVPACFFCAGRDYRPAPVALQVENRGQSALCFPS